MQFAQQGILMGNAQPLNPFEVNLQNTIFVVFDIGQSNSVGRGTSERMIQLTEDMETPSDVRYYWKDSYSSTDNGNFVIPLEGSGHTKEPDQSSVGYFGAYIMLAARIKRASPNPVYVIMMGDGGTALKQNLTSPDWYEGSSAECFQIATSYFYSVAYDKIVAEQPGKNIVPVICWHQGETDATDADGRTGYNTRFLGSGRFVESLRASHSSLNSAYMIMTRIYFQADANEAVINAVFDSYAASSQYADTIDISDVHRKIDLTTDEKGGISPSGTDDVHTSYLGHIAKADRSYALIKARFFPFANDSEDLTNNVFDPASIGTAGVRLQGSRNKVTISTYSTITAATNDLSTGTFNVFAGTEIKFKRDGKKGRFQFMTSNNSRILSSAAIGTTLFANATGFSVAFFIKPRDGQPASNMMIFHDIQNTGAAANSRVYVLLRTTGVINVVISISGTTVTVDTDAAIFTDGSQQNEKHIAVTFTNGGNINIYVNTTLVKTASMSTVNTSNYVNATNAISIGAQRTGASSFSNYFSGSIREFTIHTGVIYTQTQVNNLSLN